MIAFHPFGAPDLRTSQWGLGVILAYHAMWLRGEPGGVSANLTRANLTSANLTGANLAGANLTRANLTGANLAGANLRGANLRGADLICADLTCADLTCADLAESKGIRYASVTWHGHGERGRMLTGIKIDGGIRLFCGCFYGTEAELREYIAEGVEKYRASRTKALEFVISCLNEVES